MAIPTTIEVLGLLGVGGIIGAYFKSLWDKKKEIDLQSQNIKELRYRSTLIFMRCFLKPKSLQQFDIDDPEIRKLKREEEIKKHCRSKLIEFYYNSVLYAPDKVLSNIKCFIENPSEVNFMKTANSMRKDLWGKSKMNIADFTLQIEETSD